MLTLLKVAITGGLSCGKSSVCRFFEEQGAYVVSADTIVHQLLSPGTDLGQQIINLLGDEIVIDKKFDHGIIAKIVFNNRNLLLSLEKLVHPAVLAEIDKQYQLVKARHTAPMFIAEIPLLFEIHAEDSFDYIIDVWAEPNVCRERFKASTGYGDKQYKQRMSRQLSPEDKAKRSDYVIDNSGSLEETCHAVATIFNELSL